MNPARPRFSWRAFTSVLISFSSVALVLSGILLFVSPPGRIANWTDWTLLGLTKREWSALHICFSTVFLLGAALHFYFNLRPLLGYFKDRLTRRIGFRWEWVAALAVFGIVWGGTQAGWPPFSSLLAFNEEVKRSWEEPGTRAPLPHAELLSLAELSQKAGVEITTAVSRLAAEGITGATPDAIIEQLAQANRVSAQRIYQVVQAETGRGRGHGAGGGGGGRGAGGGAGPGGGAGQKTLADFCGGEGIDLANALERLQAKGIQASAGLTLREIAAQNGYERPYELMEILRAK